MISDETSQAAWWANMFAQCLHVTGELKNQFAYQQQWHATQLSKYNNLCCYFSDLKMYFTVPLYGH